jgi:hypothetical protein
MGATVSATTILPPFAKFSRFPNVASAAKLLKNFETEQPEFGWAIDSKTFHKVFKGTGITAGDLDGAFAAWDHQNKGTADALQMIAGAILTAKGGYLEKVGALFRLFDMDDSKSLSKSEMTILIKACANGICRMAGQTPPSTQEIMVLTHRYFNPVDRMVRPVGVSDDRLTLPEVTKWVTSCVEASEVHSLTYRSFARSKRRAGISSCRAL